MDTFCGLSVSVLTRFDCISCRMTKMKNGHFPPSYLVMLLCVTHEFKTITLSGRGKSCSHLKTTWYQVSCQKGCLYWKIPQSMLNCVFSHDVMAAIFVSQINEMAALFVSQTSRVGVLLFSYIKAFFVLATRVKTQNTNLESPFLLVRNKNSWFEEIFLWGPF